MVLENYLKSHVTNSLSLVMPAYNEEESIAAAIAEATRALCRLANSYEVIVIDDGSGDGTATAIQQAMTTDRNVRLISHATNRGYGAALRTGFDAARHPLIAFTDADCQFHLSDLSYLIARIQDHDVVCGFRVGRKDARPRRFYSGCYNLLVRVLLGVPVRDCDCALKLFRSETLSNLRIETNGFLVNAEILTKLAMSGARICQAGVRHRPRLDGQSTVSPLCAIPVAFSLLRFWWTWVLFPHQSSSAAVEPVDNVVQMHA